MNGILQTPSPLVGEGWGEGKKLRLSSPPPLPAFGELILPLQGGGESEMPRAEARGALLTSATFPLKNQLFPNPKPPTLLIASLNSLG